MWKCRYKQRKKSNATQKNCASPIVQLVFLFIFKHFEILTTLYFNTILKKAKLIKIFCRSLLLISLLQ